MSLLCNVIGLLISCHSLMPKTTCMHNSIFYKMLFCCLESLTVSTWRFPELHWRYNSPICPLNCCNFRGVEGLIEINKENQNLLHQWWQTFTFSYQLVSLAGFAFVSKYYYLFLTTVWGYVYYYTYYSICYTALFCCPKGLTMHTWSLLKLHWI